MVSSSIGGKWSADLDAGWGDVLVMKPMLVTAIGFSRLPKT